MSRFEQLFRSSYKSTIPLLLASLLFLIPQQAQAANRSLTLYNTHTKETATIVYKRGNRFDADGLRKLNRFLRDWRRNEITQMDPNLFDLIWEVYRKTGAKKPIHVVSGYRSPATNKMLRSRSRGVAKASRHTKGQALDFYLPGVSVKKIREVGMLMQAGGVGYYPSSRNPFVHIDTGNVRHWPRMTRKQLVRLFPRGNTVHVPTDRKPLKGYQTAKLKVQKTKSQMARAARSVGRFSQYAKAAPSRKTQVASLSKAAAPAKPGLLQNLLNRGPKAPPAPIPAATASATSLQAPATPPLRLASLPRPRAPQPNRVVPDIIPFGKETPDLPAIEAEKVNSEPIILAALPKPRLTPVFVTASLAPETLPGLPKAAQRPSPKTANAQLVPDLTIQGNSVDRLALTSVPSANPSADPAPVTASLPRPQSPERTAENGAAILASLTRADSNSDQTAEPGLTQTAYAPIIDEQFATLPLNGPKKRQTSSELQENTGQPKARKLARTPQNRPARTKPNLSAHARKDQLANLTFAYGPAGMGHITHIKHQTKTASFARLSRPLPGSLKGLVSKPYQVLDQGFNRRPLNLGLETRFAGPVFARMATRRFN